MIAKRSTSRRKSIDVQKKKAKKVVKMVKEKISPAKSSKMGTGSNRRTDNRSDYSEELSKFQESRAQDEDQSKPSSPTMEDYREEKKVAVDVTDIEKAAEQLLVLVFELYLKISKNRIRYGLSPRRKCPVVCLEGAKKEMARSVKDLHLQTG